MFAFLPQLAVIHQLWYALPLIVAISLVYAATRHEYPRPILAHAVRFALLTCAFMTVVLVILAAMSWAV